MFLFNWTADCQKSFDKLKESVTSALVLTIPNNDGPFCLETDASQYAVSTVPAQNQDHQWCPIAFLSKALNPTQRNYEIYDRELLSIMLALQEFRKYLMNAKEVFEVWMDHSNLQYF